MKSDEQGTAIPPRYRGSRMFESSHKHLSLGSDYNVTATSYSASYKDPVIEIQDKLQQTGTITSENETHSTYRTDYIKHELPSGRPKPVAPLPRPYVPFEGTTTYRNDFSVAAQTK